MRAGREARKGTQALEDGYQYAGRLESKKKTHWKAGPRQSFVLELYGVHKALGWVPSTSLPHQEDNTSRSYIC